ncbi:type II secretion system protein [Candidatus Woesebacteria bacterium]|nr:type II secretion system protein [Candidatus Woesebacteria bacterium]
MKRGFTLIELLISMAILGILATLGFGNFKTARLKAADAKKKSDLTTIAKSLEAYVNDHRVYPNNTLSGEIECTPACPWGSPMTDGTTTYASGLPTPTTSYVYDSDGISYTLYTRLENDNDPQAVEIAGTDCGGQLCNYKITSSNIQ